MDRNPNKSGNDLNIGFSTIKVYIGVDLTPDSTWINEVEGHPNNLIRFRDRFSADTN